MPDNQQNESLTEEVLRAIFPPYHVEKIFITGPARAGKTTFVHAFAEHVIHSEQPPFDIGYITIEEDFKLCLYSAPMPHHDSPGMGIISGFLGGVILIDSTAPDSFAEARAILDTFREHVSIPFILASNKQDLPNILSSEALGKALRLDSTIRIVPCIATNAESVKATLLEVAVW